MVELNPREVVERYAKALQSHDVNLAPSLLAEDLVEVYPQSGEVIEGLQNWLALIEHWPSLEEMSTDVDRVVGSEDRWVLGPTWNLTRIVGTGDQFWATGRVHYPDGTTWHLVQLLEVRDGRIARMTSYFAAPFEPAEWRRPWVRLVPPSPG